MRSTKWKSFNAYLRANGCDTKVLKEGFLLEGKYRIVSVIGKGGMSTVYLAVHQRLNQKWAIKEISREYCENYEMISRQLLMEADILKKLNHPGLPQIIDIIEKKNVIWMVMEFIEGKTLKDILKKKGRIEEETVLVWGRQLCDVLSYLHSRKPPIIYRDLKPENIMLQKTGRLVLIDFGTAREYCNQKEFYGEVYLGTRGYAAPEQYGNMGQTDERTDIYCLGVTLYSLLTGYSPEEPPYKIYPEKYWGKHISANIKEVILTCIQREKEKRYQSCRELSYAFSQIEYKNQKNMEKKRKKIQGLLGIILLVQFIGAAFWGYKTMTQFYKKKAVADYINAAEKSVDKKDAEKYYKQALAILPAEKETYESLIRYFVSPNNFQMEDAATLTGIVMTFYKNKTALEIFRENKQKDYKNFCYEVAIGYFYDMGGVPGKSASEKWFREVINTSGESEQTGTDKMAIEKDRDRGKRAVLYADIANYYNTFLIYGRDKSGERESKDFLDFYRTLHTLNQFDITKNSSKSDISAMYLISKEITVEITNYAEEFLRDERVSKRMLKNELEKIRKRKSFFAGEKDKMMELESFLEDAEKKIEMVGEENSVRGIIGMKE